MPDASRPTDQPRQGRRAVGHPVDVASGTFFSAWHDIEIAGQVPLILRRYFSTGLIDESSGAFGPGWTHNFAIALSETASAFALRDQNGAIVRFERPEGGKGASILNEAASMELRAEGDFYCVYHWHDWRTDVERLWFARTPTGHLRLERVSPPSGFGLTLSYDSQGRVSTVAQMIERRRISFRYNEAGLITELLVESPFSAPRLFATYRYDSQARLVEVRDAVGAPIRYAYDRAGRILTETARSGASFQMRYDGRGQCVA